MLHKMIMSAGMPSQETGCKPKLCRKPIAAEKINVPGAGRGHAYWKSLPVEAGHAHRIARSLQLLCCWAGIRGDGEHALFPYGNISAGSEAMDNKYSRTVT